MINTTCTLSTACFRSNNSTHITKTLESTIENANALMQNAVYLVIYGDNETIPLLKEKREKYGHMDKTVFVELDKNDMWAFQWVDKVNKNRQTYHPTANPRHNTEIHLIQCNKFDFVLQTIKSNPFNTTHFGWTDIFLGKDNVRFCEDYNIDVLPTLLNNVCAMDTKFHLQVQCITDVNYIQPKNKREYYSQYQWVVCGNFFISGADACWRIMTRLKEIFVETTELGYGHGDEMLYLEILDEFDQDIVRSYGDYGQTWNNMVLPVKNLHYIYHLILKRSMDMCYYKEAFHCGKAILKSFLTYADSDIITEEMSNKICNAFVIPKDIFICILNDLYQAALNYRPEEAQQIKGTY